MLLLCAVAIAYSSCKDQHDSNNHSHKEQAEGRNTKGHSHPEQADGRCAQGHNHNKPADSHEESEGGHEGEIHMTDAQMAEAEIKVWTVAPGVFSGVIKVGGQLQAASSQEETVVATAAGIVSYTNRNLTEGSPVGAGQSLITISAQRLQDGDPAQKAQAEYMAALKEYQRDEELVADKIISEKEFEQSRLRYETARVAWQAQAEHMTAKGVRVGSPIAGYVKNRMALQGDYVAVGDPILTVSQTRMLQLRADVPESDFRHLREIRSAHFRTSTGDQVYRLQDLSGRLLSYGKVTAEGSAYLPVTFEFNNIGDFVAGSYAEVWLLTRERQHVISIPTAALTEEQGIYYVYLRHPSEHGAFVKREVKPGESDGSRVEIVSGLVAGDELVVNGAYQVKLAAASAVIPHGHQH